MCRVKQDSVGNHSSGTAIDGRPGPAICDRRLIVADVTHEHGADVSLRCENTYDGPCSSSMLRTWGTEVPWFTLKSGSRQIPLNRDSALEHEFGAAIPMLIRTRGGS